MTDSTMQKQFDNETVEAENAKAKRKLFTGKTLCRMAVASIGCVAIAAGAYYVYGILNPDPWYIKALSIFGF